MKIQKIVAQATLSLGVLGLVAGVSLKVIAKPIALSKIPGTTVQISPPEGFQPSKQFSGFEQRNAGASILAIEIPVPENEIQDFLPKLSSKELLKSQGIRLIESKDIAIGRIPGKLLLVSQSARGIAFLKWIVLAATGDRGLVVTATFPESEAGRLKALLRQAVVSLSWAPKPGNQLLKHQLLEGLPFTFQTAGDLQVSSRLSSNVSLTKNGMQPPAAASQPLLILGAAHSDAYIKDIAKFSRMRLQQTPQVKNLTETSGQLKTLAGYSAFELLAKGLDQKTAMPLTVYQVIIKTNQTYYILQGFVPDSNAQTYLPVFRTIAESFRPNP